MRKSTIAVLLCGLIAQPFGAAAQETTAEIASVDMQQVEDAWTRGDFEFVRQGLEALANQTGDALAQYRYGRVLVEGRGGPVDIDGAVKWLERAVAQNQPEAAALLARIYLTDFDLDEPIETKRSPQKAADLLSLSATLGFAEGQYQFAQLLVQGVGTPKDEKGAFRWLLAASQQQHVGAQFALARAYAKGIGTEPSGAKTIEWLTAAAGSGHLEAQLLLARSFANGNHVDQSPTSAIALYRSAAQGGLIAAKSELGAMLLFGEKGAAQSVEEGVAWLTDAARNGDPNAMATLGGAFLDGGVLTPDIDQAATWYARAAQYDHGPAKTAFARLLEAGTGVEQDFDAAVILYQAAVGLGHEPAAARLGELVASGNLDGRFAPQRMVPWASAAMSAGSIEAEHWLQAQAKAGLRDAQSRLATQYLTSEDTADQGAHWLAQAAQGGDVMAQTALGKMYITGDHVALDYVLAHKWLNLAATLGASEAESLRSTVAALMTPDQIAQAQALARQWIENEQPQPPATDQSVVRNLGSEPQGDLSK